MEMPERSSSSTEAAAADVVLLGFAIFAVGSDLLSDLLPLEAAALALFLVDIASGYWFVAMTFLERSNRR